MSIFSQLLFSDDQITHVLKTAQPEPKASEVVQEEPDKNFIDSELFIRKTFEVDVEKGCELLFQSYYKPLCNHAVRFVYSKEIAEDIVADVFCTFWDTKAYKTVNISYRAYLFRSIRNRCYNYLQKEQNKTLSLDLASQQETPPSNIPERIMQYEDLSHLVDVLVRALPPQCQKIFIMNRFEGKMGKEIAKELSLSTRTVEAHIAKALSVLRNGLKNHWMELLILIQMGYVSKYFENILIIL
jgi:RNA polymerase sigma-70 factor (ECF subfamily)